MRFFLYCYADFNAIALKKTIKKQKWFLRTNLPLQIAFTSLHFATAIQIQSVTYIYSKQQRKKLNINSFRDFRIFKVFFQIRQRPLHSQIPSLERLEAKSKSIQNS